MGKRTKNNRSFEPNDNNNDKSTNSSCYCFSDRMKKNIKLNLYRVVVGK